MSMVRHSYHIQRDSGDDISQLTDINVQKGIHTKLLRDTERYITWEGKTYAATRSGTMETSSHTHTRPSDVTTKISRTHT